VTHQEMSHMCVAVCEETFCSTYCSTCEVTSNCATRFMSSAEETSFVLVLFQEHKTSIKAQIVEMYHRKGSKNVLTTEYNLDI